MRPGLRWLWLAVVVLAAVVGFYSRRTSRGKDGTFVSVSANDAEMTAAIAKARETLPAFWKVFDKPEHGESKFCLKVKITDKNGWEHLWAGEIEKRDGKTFGTIGNDPEIVTCVKCGQRIEIPEADISDWSYSRDGKMVGNRTLKALYKHMTPEQVKHYQHMMADP